jgi:hypothetical protein
VIFSASSLIIIASIPFKRTPGRAYMQSRGGIYWIASRGDQIEQGVKISVERNGPCLEVDDFINDEIFTAHVGY